MEETDVGRVFAAMVPDVVPTIGDLPARARVLGRRRRARRVAMTGGGAGIAVAAAVGVVVTLGGFGGGSSKPGLSVGPGGAQATATSTASSAHGHGSVPVGPPSATASPYSASLSSPGTKPGLPTNNPDDPVADGKVLAAVKGALPAKDADGLKLYRAGGMSTGYGAEFTKGESVLDVSVGTFTKGQAGTPTLCATDPQHCSKGTATLRGHAVRWEYYYGSGAGPSVDVYDDQASIDYLVTDNSPPSSQFLGQAELKGVALNEKVASALLAAWRPGH